MFSHDRYGRETKNSMEFSLSVHLASDLLDAAKVLSPCTLVHRVNILFTWMLALTRACIDF